MSKKIKVRIAIQICLPEDDTEDGRHEEVLNRLDSLEDQVDMVADALGAQLSEIEDGLKKITSIGVKTMGKAEKLMEAVEKVRQADASEDEKLLAIIDLLKANPNADAVSKAIAQLEGMAEQDSSTGVQQGLEEGGSLTPETPVAPEFPTTPDVQVVDVPVVDAPAEEFPVADVPVVDEPVVDFPVVDEPVDEEEPVV